MQYRDDRYGNKLSVLGFGCMRFSRGLRGIDYDKARRLIMTAIDRGVNYFDTAYIYPGSENVLGQVLESAHCRERVYIATKLPIMKVRSHADLDRLLNEQLAQLRTGYIDYYLMHNLSSLENWQQLKDLGVVPWLAEKKAEGKIKQVGFSFHGAQGSFMDLLEAYDWDFTQIQYNYMNENYQAGRAGLHAAAKKGLPVIVMEPLLGGKLANGVPKKGIDLLKKANPAFTPAGWALRWLWHQPEVTVILSGMNADEQLRDNLHTAETAEVGCLSPSEADAVAAVQAVFKEAFKIPCTGCNYCMPCPRQVNIPGIFAAYNTRFANGYVTGLTQYITGTSANTPGRSYTARHCVRCGQCEKHCPQNIEIMNKLAAVTKEMEPFWFNTVIKVINRVMQGAKPKKEKP